MKQITRRRFVQSSMIAGAAATLPACATTVRPYGRVRGANDDIRVGIIGIRGKGGGHINVCRRLPGVRVVRVEIKRIDPPADVTQAMHRQMKAERERRAMILEAEGHKQSQIERATGERQAHILQAEGEATAIRTVADATKYREIAVAEGEARAIETVYEAIHAGRPTNDLIAIKYLEALQAVANGTATKIFLPMEMSGVMGSIGGIAELFRSDGDNGDNGDPAPIPAPRRAGAPPPPKPAS